MHIPTERTQARLRELFHGEVCPGRTCDWNDADPDSSCYRIANRSAVIALGQLLPVVASEMFPAVRDDMREKIHDRIVGELVCCDVFEAVSKAIEDGRADPHRDPKDVAHHLDMPWHAMCYYAGWSAWFALHECPSGLRKCRPSFWCPTVGRWESPCHGGFDVCCDRPHLHQTIEGPGAATPGSA